jgi:hypothetical protein
MILRNVLLWAEFTDARGVAIGPRNLPSSYAPCPPLEWWETTTPEDVANMLADADMAPRIEAMTPAERDKAAVALAAQRRDLALRVINAVGTWPLAYMAYEIDQQRLIYAPFLKEGRNDPEDQRLRHRRGQVSPDLFSSSIGRHAFENLQRSAEPVEPKDRRRILKAIATLRRLLPREHARLLAALSDFQPSPRGATLWHHCAFSLALIYFLELAPTVGWSRDGVPICFIQQALRWVGFPSSVQRTTIAKAVLKGQGGMRFERV